MYTIGLAGWLQWGVRQLIEAEILMTSVERINEYAQLPHEEDEGGQKRLVKTPPEWPSRGIIEFRNYSLRYRSDSEPVLKNINVRIESGEKIGVIGRTGAYKIC
jgi:ABC-type multidrug transport system fused ATPase/permease subunit